MQTIRVRMTASRSGSPDGIRVRRYREGECHELPEALARIFLEQGWARPAHESKDRGAAPENKAGQATDAGAGGLRAVHRGFGRWEVVDAAGRRVNRDWLGKKAAQALAGRQG